jgi:SAM-dependent methyltransferase
MQQLSSGWSAAWRDPQHKAGFDLYSRFSEKRLRQHWQRFNEVNMLRAKADRIQGNELLDLGCATGEFYRYCRSILPQFRYHGCDIDEQLVSRAREKYPDTHFFESAEDLSNIRQNCPSPAVVFNRDVIPFCPEPFVYLRKLLEFPTSAAVLRLRTRDAGASVLDPDRSCAFLHGKWIPYMVLNVDELVSCITAVRPVEEIIIQKSYEILGGESRRFLPKECYYPETGTAATAVFIQFAGVQDPPPKITIGARPDGAPLATPLDRSIRLLKRVLPI